MRIALDEKDLCDILATHLGLAGLEGAEIKIDIENNPFSVVITGLSVNQLVKIHATLVSEQNQEQASEEVPQEPEEDLKIYTQEDSLPNVDNISMGSILANSASLLNRNVPGRVPKDAREETSLTLNPKDLR
jgi:hypothetical protein